MTTAAPTVLASFLAYLPTVRGGVFVAAGDINGDGIDDVITGPGIGHLPLVRVFDGSTLPQDGPVEPIVKFAAYPYSFRGGVMVAVGDANGDCQPDIITGAGPLGTNEVRYFDGATLRNDNGLGVPLESITAFPPSVTGGVFVGGSPAMPLSVYEFTPPPPPGDGEGSGHRGSQAGQGPLALSAGAVQPTATDDGSAMTADELDRVFADDALLGLLLDAPLAA